MNLPGVAGQAIYLDASWAVVLAALALALLASTRPEVGRRGAIAVCLLAALSMFLPGPLSPSHWLGMVFQYPSAVLAGLCGWSIVRRLRGGEARSRRAADLPPLLPMGPALAFVALGVPLYAGTFALLPVDLYFLGFANYAGLALATALVVLWWLAWPQARVHCAIVAAAALLHAATRLPTGNAWDALLDPILFVWAVAVVARGAMRAARRAAAT